MCYGVELARKDHRQWPDIGLVVTSGHSRFADSELPNSGWFIAKPARPEVLVKVIERAAGQLRRADMQGAQPSSRPERTLQGSDRPLALSRRLHDLGLSLHHADLP